MLWVHLIAETYGNFKLLNYLIPTVLFPQQVGIYVCTALVETGVVKAQTVLKCHFNIHETDVVGSIKRTLLSCHHLHRQNHHFFHRLHHRHHCFCISITPSQSTVFVCVLYAEGTCDLITKFEFGGQRSLPLSVNAC